MEGSCIQIVSIGNSDVILAIHAASARSQTGPTLDPISLPAEQAEQVQALYDLLSKDGKPRLVAQEGETGLELSDAVCQLLLKVVGGLQQGKAISIRVAAEPTNPAYDAVPRTKAVDDNLA